MYQESKNKHIAFLEENIQIFDSGVGKDHLNRT